MVEHRAVRWVLIVLFALAVVALIAYARGDDGDDGRSPELGESLATPGAVGIG